MVNMKIIIVEEPDNFAFWKVSEPKIIIIINYYSLTTQCKYYFIKYSIISKGMVIMFKLEIKVMN